DTGVATGRATENADAEDLLGTRVVGDAQSRLLLDHLLLLDLDWCVRQISDLDVRGRRSPAAHVRITHGSRKQPVQSRPYTVRRANSRIVMSLPTPEPGVSQRHPRLPHVRPAPIGRTAPHHPRCGWWGAACLGSCRGREALLGLLEHLDQTPALRRGQRTGLHQLNAVADAGQTVLVVRLHLGRTADDLAVQRVLHSVLELDDDGLLHLVRDDVTDADLTARALFLVAHSPFHTHATSPAFGPVASPSSRSRSTV